MNHCNTQNNSITLKYLSLTSQTARQTVPARSSNQLSVFRRRINNSKYSNQKLQCCFPAFSLDMWSVSLCMCSLMSQTVDNATGNVSNVFHGTVAGYSQLSPELSTQPAPRYVSRFRIQFHSFRSSVRIGDKNLIWENVGVNSFWTAHDIWDRSAWSQRCNAQRLKRVWTLKWVYGKVYKMSDCHKKLHDAVHVARDTDEYFKSPRSSVLYGQN